MENPTIVKGYAYDAAGNVLYVYQEVEAEENPLYTYPGEAKYPVMEWVPVGE